MATVIGLPEHSQPVFPLQCAACLAPARHCHDIAVTVVTPAVVMRDGVAKVVGERREHRSFSIPYCEWHLRQSTGAKRRLRRARGLRVVLSLLLSVAAAALVALLTHVSASLPVRELLRAVAVIAGVFALTLAVSYPLLLLPAVGMAGVQGACRAMYRWPDSVSLAVTALPAPRPRRRREKTPPPEVVLRFASRRYAEVFMRRNAGLGPV
jgi:hypothetical protein